ncbi:MAG: DUF885 domain-containing protein [Candidatus Marinimicrobia bacterium]|nr:DUF885 domain-containing protein [Candidatus Neomarinimicrobiota bacterium]
MKYSKPGSILVLLISLIIGFSCQRDSTEWANFVDSFMEQYFEYEPTSAVYAGRHEYDGQLPDRSPDAINAYIAWLKGQREAAQRFEVDRLTESERFEREYLLGEIDGQLFWLEKAGWPYKNPRFYGLSPDVYVSREYAPLNERLRAYITYAGNVPAAVEQMRSNLQTPLPKTYVQLGRIIFGGLASFLADDIPGIFAAVDDQDLLADFQAANATAIQAFADADEWFQGLEAGATDDFALGAELFSEMLWTNERINLPLEELEAIGRADLERNLAALDAACSKYAPGASIKDCIAKVQAAKPADGPVQAAREQLTGLKVALIELDLVSIPGTEEALVNESPPHRRWNAAYIDIPGPYEENLPSIYYIAPPDPSWTEAEQQAYIPGLADLMFISVHEVWPGHFLQFLHANRAASKFGQIFGSYAFTEGWAHYSEELSRDIAKLIPFGLLAVFLLDISTLSLNAPFAVLQEMFPVLKMLVYYFLFILVLEITLRLLFHGKKY